MRSEGFSFGWNDDEGSQEPHGHAPVSGSVDALEEWLESNYHLWQLGLQLAVTAQHYREAYKHIPFNQSGWFSPN